MGGNNMEAKELKIITAEEFNNITDNTLHEPLNESLTINEDGSIILVNNSNLA